MITPLYFSGRNKQLSPEAAARREQDNIARQRREAMPFSFQMVAPILPGQTGARQMDRLERRLTRCLHDEPQLLEAARELSPAHGDGSALKALRDREAEFLTALGPVTDLFMTDVSGTKGLPETISAIENETLREHLMNEYLMHVYHENDQQIIDVLTDIKDKEASADWRLALLSRPEPRFLTTKIGLLTSLIKSNSLAQKQLGAEKNSKKENTQTRKPDGKKTDATVKESPEELQNNKKILLLLLKEYTHQASAAKNMDVLIGTANALLDLSDEDLDSLELNPDFLVRLGALGKPPEEGSETSGEDLRYLMTLALLMNDNVQTRFNGVHKLGQMKNAAQRRELAELVMTDSSDTCRAALLGVRLGEDIVTDEPDDARDARKAGTTEDKKLKTGETVNDQGTPVLTPDQFDQLLLDLSGRKTNYRWPWDVEGAVVRYINRASSDDVKFRVASAMMERNHYCADTVQAWGFWQMEHIEDDQMKSRFIKQHFKNAHPENNRYISGIISTIKDEAVLEDLLTHLTRQQRVDLWANAVKDCGEEKMPAPFQKHAAAFCRQVAEGVKTGNMTVQDPKQAFMMATAISDPQERLTLLETIAESPDLNVRRWADLGIACIQPLSARAAYTEKLLADKDPEVRKETALRLGYLPEGDMVRIAKKIMNDPDPAVRGALASVPRVMSWGNQHNKSIFFDRLSQPDNTLETREKMAKNVHRIKNDETRDRVIDRLAHDPDPVVRQEALRNINKIKDPKTRTELARRYSHYPDYSTRESMAEVVRMEAVPNLNALLADMPEAELDMMLKPFVADVKKVSRERWMGLAHISPALQQMALLDIEAGQLQTVAMPQFYKLKDHAKSLVNMYNDPEDWVTKPKEVDTCFREYRSEILAALILLGPEPLKHKLTLTLDPFRNLLFAIMKLPKEPRLLKPLYEIAHLPNVDPIEITKVLEMTAGLCVMNQPEKAIEALQAMADNKQIEAGSYSKTYLREFFRQYNPGQTPSESQLDQWDMNMVHNLYYVQDKLSRRNRASIVSQLMTALNTGTLENYLENEALPAGEANKRTAQDYKHYGLDMPTWLNYDKTRGFSVFSGDDIAIRKQMVSVIFDELSAMMSKLMGSRREEIAGLLDQQTAQGMFTDLKKSRLAFGFEEGRFVYKGEHPLSVETLQKLLTMLEGSMAARGVWKRAKSDEELANVKKRFAAMNALLDECDQINKPCANYEIRMWNRDPRTGIFLGSHGTNCVAAEGFNNAEMITYLTSHAFHMVEIHDKAVKDPVGLAFLYWVTDPEGQVSLAVDSVDISKKYLKQTNQRAIRDNLVTYLQDFAAAVTGKEGTPILMGKLYNDIPTKDLKTTAGKYRFIGDTQNNQAYVEMLGGIRSLSVWSHCEPFVLA